MAARILPILLTCCLSSIAMAQGLPPLGSGTQPPPPPSGLPPLGAPADAKPGTSKAPSGSLSVDAANADFLLVETVPDTIAWAGVKDRLKRAGETE